jgi:hypothetical protein
LDLTNVPIVGDLRGESKVWVAFVFISDNDGNVDDGAFIDNSILRRQILASGPTAGMWEEKPADELPDTLIQRNLSVSISEGNELPE